MAEAKRGTLIVWGRGTSMNGSQMGPADAEDLEAVRTLTRSADVTDVHGNIMDGCWVCTMARTDVNEVALDLDEAVIGYMEAEQ